ncbi:hypothetical protein [Sorangium sp. So ce1099]|uniref:hypothetical protein n=1 Tax=unclassified Sorangium TaxID=2621164 RepID=UPI003F62E991
MNTYLICSDEPEVEVRGVMLRGVPCETRTNKPCGRPHYYYAIDLDPPKAPELFAPHPQRGRRVWGDFFVSDSTCGVPIGPGGGFVKLKKYPPRSLNNDQVSALRRLAESTHRPDHMADVRKRPRRGTKWEPLSGPHKEFISAEIAQLIRVARDPKHHMEKVARALIDTLLWCWTADGVDSRTGQAGRDKMKYSFDHQYFTIDAYERWMSQGRRASGLRHEHAVPRCVLIHWMISQPDAPNNRDVLSFLETNCFAVIVTTEENISLNKRFRDSMPDTWACRSPNPNAFARYDAVGLRDQVRRNGRPAEPAAAAGRASRGG